MLLTRSILEIRCNNYVHNNGSALHIHKTCHAFTLVSILFFKIEPRLYWPNCQVSDGGLSVHAVVIPLRNSNNLAAALICPELSQLMEEIMQPSNS